MIYLVARNNLEVLFWSRKKGMFNLTCWQERCLTVCSYPVCTIRPHIVNLTECEYNFWVNYYYTCGNFVYTCLSLCLTARIVYDLWSYSYWSSKIYGQLTLAKSGQRVTSNESTSLLQRCSSLESQPVFQSYSPYFSCLG